MTIVHKLVISLHKTDLLIGMFIKNDISCFAYFFYQTTEVNTDLQTIYIYYMSRKLYLIALTLGSGTSQVTALGWHMSASHVVGCGFASRPGHTKDHHKNGTNCLPTLHACVRVGV